jgi:HlyD family secretion protein
MASATLRRSLPPVYALGLCLTLGIGCLIPGCSGPSHGDPAKQSIDPRPRNIIALGRIQPAGGIVSIGAVPGPGQFLKAFMPGIVEGGCIQIPRPENSHADKSGQQSETNPNGAEPDKAHDVESSVDPHILGYLASRDIHLLQLESVKIKQMLSERNHSSQLRMAQMRWRQAEATWKEAKAKRAEVLASKRQLDNLKTASKLAADQVKSLTDLKATDPDLVTQNQLDQETNKSERAEIESEIANERYAPTLTAAKAACLAAWEGVKIAKENINRLEETHKTELMMISQEKKLANYRLKQSELRLPDSIDTTAEYTILKINLKQGEFVTQMPIMLVGDLRNMVCVAEVYEADAKEIQVGQSVSIVSPAFSSPFGLASDKKQKPFDPAKAKAIKGPGKQTSQGIRGKVQRIGSMVVSSGIANRNPLAPADRSVVEVLIQIDPSDLEATREAARHVDMQVRVEFGEKPAMGDRQVGVLAGTEQFSADHDDQEN